MFRNRRKVRIEWGDCDPAGIVFYPRYFAICDASTHALFEAVFPPETRIFEHYGVLGYPLVNARAEFRIPSSYSEELTVESYVAEWRNSSFSVEHKFYKGERLALEGFETRVWAARHPDDPKRIVSRPIPQDLMDRFK